MNICRNHYSVIRTVIKEIPFFNFIYRCSSLAWAICIRKSIIGKLKSAPVSTFGVCLATSLKIIHFFIQLTYCGVLARELKCGSTF